MADASQEAVALEKAKLEQEKERLIQEMTLERERLRQEVDLKTQQFAHEEKLRVLQLDQEKELKSKEIENQAAQLSKVQWSSPAVVAVIAGFLGIATTLVTTYESGVQTRDLERQKLENTLKLGDQTSKLERQKQEGTIILEALKAGGTGTDRTATAAANLVLFADAGLITIPPEKLENLRLVAGDTSPSLPSSTGSNQPSYNPKAYEKIKQDLSYAINYLNQRFRMHLDVPSVKPSDFTNDKNAYWDGKQYIAPSDVQFLPDITYVNAVHPYVMSRAKLAYQGEPGALFYSYAYVFASVIKQKRLNQTARTADWTIAPKGIALLLGEDLATTQRTEPIASLKAPGTAYSDPKIGKDPQVAHMKDYVRTSKDNGGVHTNCGIPNKAFYETAFVIGSGKAGDIWYEALLKLKPQSGFHDAAIETTKAAGALFGANSPEQNAVMQAWKTVGVRTSP